MHLLTFVIFTLIAFSIEISFAQSNCKQRNDIGTISDTQKLSRNNRVENCWTIKVPEQKNAKIEVSKLTVERMSYSGVYLKIGEHTLRPPLESNFKTLGLKDTTVTFYAENTRNANGITAEFELNYKVESLACDQADAFRCSETECVPKSERCDGVSNCENNADERDCGDVVDTGNDQMKAARDKALQYLKDMMYMRGGWGDKTPDAVIAMHLATGTDFQEKLEEKLIAKDLELHVCQNSGQNTADTLAKFINALLSDGIDSTMLPTEDLIVKLKAAVSDLPTDNDKALSYLALCNAKEDLTSQIPAIKSPLSTGSDDQKYYAAMTIDCLSRQTDHPEVTAAVRELKTAIRPLKRRQRNDGSFDGNTELSAKFVQAIMASNTSDVSGWNQKAALDYLMNQVEKSRNNFDAIALILPILGGRTQADIGRNGKSKKGSVVKKNESRKRISLRYGNTDIITRILEVKQNITAFEFLQFAAEEDSTFSFQTRYIDDKINIYKLAGLANDPTAGKYWQFYFSKDGAEHAETKLEEGLDAFMMTGVKELILWYKTLEVKNEVDAGEEKRKL